MLRPQRLDQHVDKSIAAEAEAPHRVFITARVVGHDLGQTRRVHFARTLGEIGLEESPTNEDYSRLIDPDGHPRADTTVTGAADSNDSGEDDRLIRRRRVRQGLDDGSVGRHG